ncbi:hypothetical protein DLH84_12545 [Vibrio parahaemolyticus]|nr:hypothetical protein [Vibrio parahaemolyticus]EGR1247635.1 hypothetical protein [Vibrio parahaemolyticus]EGR3128977.1 hypothetical protein [Vibrio parahaemolyticus]KYZ07769.1 hypothetical protein AW043_02430 [Vibrio parahaemolyticus]ODZ06835.1 hypothetical protein BBM34_19155 [Vibrio parahaemolyticus]
MTLKANKPFTVGKRLVSIWLWAIWVIQNVVLLNMIILPVKIQWLNVGYISICPKNVHTMNLWVSGKITFSVIALLSFAVHFSSLIP